MNYYKALGVAQNADADAIQSAYDAMVQKYHPDINPEGGEKFKQINKAYETLRDPKKRKEYNATLGGATPSTSNVGAKPKTPQNGGGARQPPGGAMTGGMDDILNNIRNQGQRNAQSSRPASGAGNTPTVEIALTMSEIMHGAVKPIIVNGKKIHVRIRLET